METLLSYGKDANKSQLSTELFYKDEADRMGETVIVGADNHNPNSGLQKRRASVSKSKEFDMMGRIHGDTLFLARYLLNEVGMKIELVRSNDNFSLMGAADCKAACNIINLSVYRRNYQII